MQSSVGIIGASGFAGSETLRLVLEHPEIHLVWCTADSQVGTRVADLYPSLAARVGEERYRAFDESLLGEVDTVITALPHGASQALMPGLLNGVDLVIDLAADFRLPDAALYPLWYGEEHTCPDLLGRFVYGLPERNRAAIVGAQAIAAPGCYPTASILTVAPFVERLGEMSGPVIVNAVSGVSGAGRPPKDNTTFCAVDENVAPYGLVTHRHTPEIELYTGASVVFVPHLVPMNRGILVTSYIPIGDCHLDTETALTWLAETYAHEPFVVVSERLPATKSVQGSNCIHLSARVDERRRMVIAMGVIDNLVKGTAGQAIQCWNIAVGREETMGLTSIGLAP